MSALVLGWKWSTPRVQDFVTNTRVIYGSLVAVGTLAVAANAFVRFDVLARPSTSEFVLWLFATGNLGIVSVTVEN